MQLIEEAGSGVFVNLRGHEGRGFGFSHKLAAYNLQNQEQGHKTDDANLKLGLVVEAREYEIGAQAECDELMKARSRLKKCFFPLPLLHDTTRKIFMSSHIICSEKKLAANSHFLQRKKKLATNTLLFAAKKNLAANTLLFAAKEKVGC